MQFIIDVASSHRADTFGDPLKFNPMRFLEENLDTPLNPGGKHSYIPFGTGKRTCIGGIFAVQMLKIVLIRFCANLKVENNALKEVVNQMEGVSWRPKTGSLQQKFTVV